MPSFDANRVVTESDRQEAREKLRALKKTERLEEDAEHDDETPAWIGYLALVGLAIGAICNFIEYNSFP